MAEAAIDAESMCRACTGLHSGDKMDLLETPNLTELYNRLSASHLDPDDSLPKQICSMCFNRLNDFKNFQEMCVASYKLLLLRFPKHVDLKEEDCLMPVIKDEKPEILVSLVDLSHEEVDCGGDHAFNASEDIDRSDYEDDKKNTDYDPLKNDGKLNTFEKKTGSEVKHYVIDVDSDDEKLAAKAKRSIRDRKKKMKRKRWADDDDDDDEFKPENDDYADDIDDVSNGEEEGEKHPRTTKSKKRKRDRGRTQKHKSESYACSKCSRKFYKKERYEAHIRKHECLKVSIGSYACSKCSRKFFKKERYEAHIRQHEGLKPYACPHCHKQYTNSLRLKNHLSEHSENPLRFSCTFDGCDKVYRDRKNLNSHINSHFNPPKPVDKTDRPVFICELCGKALSSRVALGRHTLIHSDGYPFECDVCPRKYRTRPELNKHKKRHIRNHECLICGLKKMTSHELNIHMNVHTGAKKFQCNLCDSCFVNNGNLVQHVRVVHEGIKTYNCPYCNHSFGKSEHLKHHVMRHTGEKPHECPICEKRFIQKTTLQLHVKRHHKAKNGEKLKPLRPVSPTPLQQPSSDQSPLSATLQPPPSDPPPASATLLPPPSGPSRRYPGLLDWGIFPHIWGKF